MPRLACVLVPLFPLAARLRSEPELAPQAVAILEGNGNAARVIAATRLARERRGEARPHSPPGAGALPQAGGAGARRAVRARRPGGAPGGGREPSRRASRTPARAPPSSTSRGSNAISKASGHEHEMLAVPWRPQRPPPGCRRGWGSPAASSRRGWRRAAPTPPPSSRPARRRLPGPAAARPPGSRGRASPPPWSAGGSARSATSPACRARGWRAAWARPGRPSTRPPAASTPGRSSPASRRPTSRRG